MTHSLLILPKTASQGHSINSSKKGFETPMSTQSATESPVMPDAASGGPVYPSEEWQRAYMRTLADQIWVWKDEYYNKMPTVDDATYDHWWRNLLFLESKYPHQKDPNSPTVGVGAPVLVVRRLTLAEMRASLR
jgi:hypothetical protein